MVLLKGADSYEKSNADIDTCRHAHSLRQYGEYGEGRKSGNLGGKPKHNNSRRNDFQGRSIIGNDYHNGSNNEHIKDNHK